MPNCAQDISSERLEFGQFERRVIEGRFDGGNMTSDGGVMLLAKLDQRLGLTDAAACSMVDPRKPSSITHSIRAMRRQRVNGWVQGLEGLNDHSQLRRMLSKARIHAEVRLRTHLMTRHKVKGKGSVYRRFPNADLCERYRLYKVPVVAGWRNAHAVA